MARESKRRREARRFGMAERLIDRAFSDEWGIPPWIPRTAMDAAFREDLRRDRDAYLARLQKCPVIVADNVCEFFYAENAKEVWGYETDFPACAPPFPEFFLECGRPSCIRIEDQSIPATGLPERWGWLFHAEDQEDIRRRFLDPEARRRTREGLKAQMDALWPKLDQQAVQRLMAAHPTGSLQAQEGIRALGQSERTFLVLCQQYQLLKEARLEIPEDLGWMLDGRLLIAGRDQVYAPTIFTILIRKSGQLFPDPTYLTVGQSYASQKESLELTDSWPYLVFPALMAISLMNCKNVVLDPVEPDRELNRERQRHGHRPFVRYHTINIEPMKQVLRTEGNLETVGLKRALHRVRGHFATYTEEKRLFGRVAGTFWIPAHRRGDLKEGVVVSDYKVNKPS